MDDDTNYVYGEVAGVEPEFKTHTERASLEDILAIAKEIWARVNSSGVDVKDDAGNDKLLAEVQKEFKDFTASFPLILRWIVQARKYNYNALRKYLMKHAHTELNSREKLLELQAEYLVFIYREEHPRVSTKLIHEYRRRLVEQLHVEDKQFLEMHKQAEKEVEDFNKAVDAERRKEILARLVKLRANRAPA